MPTLSTDMSLSAQLGSIHPTSEPFSGTSNPGINNFGITYGSSLFGDTVYDPSSLFTSSDDPMPDMSYSSSVPRGFLDSEYNLRLVEGYISEEKLAKSFGLSDSQWNSVNL
jgi:hypothetical protein